MYSILIALFILVALLMILVILVQSGKGGGLAGIAGGGDMGGVFGGKGSAPFLVKATTILATLFMLIALVVGIMTRGSADQSSIMQREREQRMSSPARTLPEVPSEQPAPGQMPQN
ncbi:MAG: preprotein translocase subunit SecG [candidate division KSB1 bacterium]|nr:preprotein translocase subunit SecG [candidate division KSB1 bacterium]